MSNQLHSNKGFSDLRAHSSLYSVGHLMQALRPVAAGHKWHTIGSGSGLRGPGGWGGVLVSTQHSCNLVNRQTLRT